MTFTLGNVSLEQPIFIGRAKKKIVLCKIQEHDFL